MRSSRPGDFVLPEPPSRRERHDRVDLYLPDAGGPRPAIVFVHGGPVPADRRPTPRDWPVYRGYGALAAAGGAVGVTVDHRLHAPEDYPVAARDVADAVEFARADPRVAADRVAIWCFSGGGLILADWLRDPPPWLRCVGATYPLLAPTRNRQVDPRFRPVEAVAGAGALPIVLTRAGREAPEIAETVAAFVTAARAAGAALRVIDVPHGRHAFDMLDYTDESRDAVRLAVATVLDLVGADGSEPRDPA